MDERGQAWQKPVTPERHSWPGCAAGAAPRPRPLPGLARGNPLSGALIDCWGRGRASGEQGIACI